MISPENMIFDRIASALREKYGKSFYVSGEYSSTLSKFPAVTVVEESNSVYQRARTANIENAVSVMYEVNVYDNTVGYKKQNAKEIMELIDGEFASLGFTRTMCNPVSNLEDATIYRIVARYTGVVDRDLWIYTG